MTWTPERVNMLKDLWSEGLSASQVAARIGAGISRNAVIGKVHRLGISQRATGSAPKPSVARQRRATASSPPKRVVAVAASPRQMTPEPPPEFSPDNVTLFKLTAHRCRWPLGDPKEKDFRFCGAKIGASEQVYCTYHTHVAYQGGMSQRASGEKGRPIRQTKAGA